MKKVSAIIEARMTSSRLPGKVLMEINKKPVLWYLIRRLKKIKRINNIILATTTNKEDDELVNLAKKNKIKFYRGSEHDVMQRVLFAARKFKTDIIVSITGDCPIIDHNLVSQCLNSFLKNNVDYLSNSNIRSYPDGMDVQVYNYQALRKSYSLTRSMEDKEHVTLHIRKNPNKFKILNIVAPSELHYPNLGLTLDYYQDFILIKKLINFFNKKKNYYFTCEDILKIYKKNKFFFKINKKMKRNVVQI
jgi:spore coat polysaccharide biosynthesis protein SpsF